MAVTRTFNRVIRAGFTASNRPCEERARYEQVTVRMGLSRVERDKGWLLRPLLRTKRSSARCRRVA